MILADHEPTDRRELAPRPEAADALLGKASLDDEPSASAPSQRARCVLEQARSHLERSAVHFWRAALPGGPLARRLPRAALSAGRERTTEPLTPHVASPRSTLAFRLGHHVRPPDADSTAASSKATISSAPKRLSSTNAVSLASGAAFAITARARTLRPQPRAFTRGWRALRDHRQPATVPTTLPSRAGSRRRFTVELAPKRSALRLDPMHPTVTRRASIRTKRLSSTSAIDTIHEHNHEPTDLRRGP